MIGRYVLATAAVVLLVVGLLLGAVVYLGLHYGVATDSRVRIGTLAEALTPTADGLQLDPARTPADWLQGYAWAMALDDDGSVICRAANSGVPPSPRTSASCPASALVSAASRLTARPSVGVPLR